MDRPLVAAALALAAIEAALGVAVARGGSLALVLGAHACVLAGSGLWLLRPSRRRMPYAVLLWIATAAFGPLGGIGTLVAATLARLHARRARSLDDWHAELFPPASDATSDLWRRIGQRAHDRPATQDVTPFLDILAFGSVPQRQAAIATIVQQFHPAFASALRAALRDEHNVIRVQAATAIARLEEQFFDKTLQLEAAQERAPEDADATLALALHHDEQAFAGLFDPAREQHCRTQAGRLYERYLDRRPDDLEVEFRLARLLLRCGRVAEAEPRFRHLVDRGDPTARLWLMECLFAQGRFGEVRDTAVDWDARSDQARSPEADASVELWGGGAEGVRP